MNENAYQHMPSRGRLAKNRSLSHEALLERIAPFLKDTVYSYIVDTVEYENGRLYQTGSGPNFQGDLITLCSCKHFMRTFSNMQPGVWIAGFTSYRVMDQNWLFYLMRVSWTFESHRDFWFSDDVSGETKRVKAADSDRFGDIYQPVGESGNPYSYRSYLEPCKKHVHRDSRLWHKDIRYVTRYGRRPALLVADPEYSFLWDRPRITSPSKLPRSQKKDSLSALFLTTSSIQAAGVSSAQG